MLQPLRGHGYFLELVGKRPPSWWAPLLGFVVVALIGVALVSR